MSAILSIRGLTKTYASGLKALDAVDLDTEKGETCAARPERRGQDDAHIVRRGDRNGRHGHGGRLDTQREYRQARRRIGLLQVSRPDMCSRRRTRPCASRGLFGRPRDPALLERGAARLAVGEAQVTASTPAG